MDAKTILRDSWRTIAAMTLVLCAMFASVLVLENRRETSGAPALAERTAEPLTTIRIFVETE